MSNNNASATPVRRRWMWIPALALGVVAGRALSPKSSATVSHQRSEQVQPQMLMPGGLLPRSVYETFYTNEPLREGVLTVSDRIVRLDGEIASGVGDEIVREIDRYVDIDPKAPIFLLIDSSPGGSVFEGLRILDAIRASPAPVYVVANKYACSMAALLVSLTDHSVILPSTIILHHEMRVQDPPSGSVRQQRELVERLSETSALLLNPLAERMKTTPEALTEEFYKRDVDGDWLERGEKAVALGWARHVVKAVRLPPGQRWRVEKPAMKPDQGGGEQQRLGLDFRHASEL